MSLETQYLERRVRRSYRDGWSYLDPHEDAGMVTILQKSGHVFYDEYDERAHTSYVVLHEGRGHFYTPAAIIEAIRDTFGGSNCQHEHDCCGCWSRYVQNVEFQGDGFYAFEVVGTRNY